MTLTNHKTFSGLTKAARKLAAELSATRISDNREYDHYNDRVDNLRDQLKGLWSNPAQAEEADILNRDLVNAWNMANGFPTCD